MASSSSTSSPSSAWLPCTTRASWTRTTRRRWRSSLQNADRLDKTVVGDYLGKEETYQDGFCVKVLHSYGEQMDFSGACRCPFA